MLAFPEMLVPAAEAAGMPVPPDTDKYDEVKNEFPHFFVFCQLQLCRSMAMDGEHFRNAELIAKIPAEELKTMALEDFLAKGLEWRS